MISHRLIAAASAFLFAASSPALATAVYSTLATSEFRIGRANFVDINSTMGSKTEVGTGSAVFFGGLSGLGTLPATITVGVSGSASALPDSSATSTYMAGHVIRIDNLDRVGSARTTRLSIPFELRMTWSIAASVDDMFREFSSAGVFFGISGFELGIDAINITGDGLDELTDTPGNSAFVFNPFVTSFGPTSSSGTSVLVAGVIIVEANSIGEFSVITDTTGRAFAVPEPASTMLLTVALVAAWASRRRLA